MGIVVSVLAARPPHGAPKAWAPFFRFEIEPRRIAASTQTAWGVPLGRVDEVYEQRDQHQHWPMAVKVGMP
jgi:hypothetical protein